MNLYEWEGKQLYQKYGIAIPEGVVVKRGEVVKERIKNMSFDSVVVKAQVLSGKRGKHNAIRFCSSLQEIENAVSDLFAMNVRGQYVSSVRIEEKLAIAQEYYLSITYDTKTKQPILLFSTEGGVDIEDVAEKNIQRIPLIISNPNIPSLTQEREVQNIAQKLWECFLQEDIRLAEINPLIKTQNNTWIAADAKIAIDDDAFFRHDEWNVLEERTMMGRLPTKREVAVKNIDKGEGYYRGTAGKYIEMDGDIAVLFSGGGASIAAMDALIRAGLSPANYTEYSGNPPKEKVYELAKIVLSKPGIRGLWIAGAVANFTDIAATFSGIIQALDEVQPTFPIVVRRAGPNDTEAVVLMQECARRNGFPLTIFGKEVGIDETVNSLVALVNA
ncbi:MAG: hypothetical protein CL685_00070 [Candidatus Magasanikbacteria bacterium]|nr:hypothetical protein [Candidatus Magasanikbacteria bacterium]|tara:strand:+ start:10104 stop:11267 length:1164 start_codon:yes stop_codon:yes gene_type:complete